MARIAKVASVQELNGAFDLGSIASVIAFDPDSMREENGFALDEGAIEFGDQHRSGKTLVGVDLCQFDIAVPDFAGARSPGSGVKSGVDSEVEVDHLAANTAFVIFEEALTIVGVRDDTDQSSFVALQGVVARIRVTVGFAHRAPPVSRFHMIVLEWPFGLLIKLQNNSCHEVAIENCDS